jgi:cytochrome c551/c552
MTYSMKIHYKHLALFLGTLFCCSFNSMGQDGAAIFQQNCAACHKLGMRLVGPDLLGVSDTRSEEWLIKFIRSSQDLVQAGDPDAVAIFEEFNKIAMTPFDLSDDEIKSILAYIKSESPESDASASDTPADEVTEPAEIINIEYADEDIEAGRLLFSGKNKFVNGGPSCLTCHNVTNDLLWSGGLLAKDLTNVYSRMGDAGVAGILGAPPFPAMAVSYKNNELDSLEIIQLTAFLKQADSISSDQEVKSGANIFIIGGGGGLIILLLIFAFHWNKRLKDTVKHDIYKRQIKSI